MDCGKELKNAERRHSLCTSCAHKLPYREGKTCEDCAVYIEDGRLCRSCMVAKPYFDKLLAPFDYDGVISKIIIGYKDNGNTFYYQYIAKHLLDYFMASGERADFIAYVPSDKKAIRRRGFEHNKNVAEIFAASYYAELIFPLERVRSAQDQTLSDKAKRAENVKNAFAFRRGFKKDVLKGKTVLLIDDVVTTGATANECARVLKGGGADCVIMLALARR